MIRLTRHDAAIFANGAIAPSGFSFINIDIYAVQTPSKDKFIKESEINTTKKISWGKEDLPRTRISSGRSLIKAQVRSK